MWWNDVEPKVFSVTKARLQSAIGDTFPNIYYTTQIQTLTESQFPCIYVHLIDTYEIGGDTEGLTVNGIVATFQVEAYVNTTQADCVAIMSAAIEQLKKMRFQVVSFPLYTSNGNVFRGVFRVRRPIGADDTL